MSGSRLGVGFFFSPTTNIILSPDLGQGLDSFLDFHHLMLHKIDKVLGIGGQILSK